MRTDAALLRTGVLQCSVTLTRIAAKTTKPVCPACIGLDAERAADPRGKSETFKRIEPEGI
jgi:hypothetical protein